MQYFARYVNEGREFKVYSEHTDALGISGSDLNRLCYKVVSDAGVVWTPDRSYVEVEIFAERSEFGSLHTNLVSNLVVYLTKPQMSDDAFNEHCDKLLKPLPKCFHQFVIDVANERSGADGRTAVLCSIGDLVKQLAPLAATYRNIIVNGVANDMGLIDSKRKHSNSSL